MYKIDEPSPTPDDIDAYLATCKSAAELEAEARAEVGIGRAWTAGDLLGAQFPAATYIIPDLLPAGLSILGGRPKIGKSWLLLQMAIAVGTGGRFLSTPVQRRKVLVLALEDSPQRLRDRLSRLGCPADADITFYTEWPSLAQQGAIYLQAEIEAGNYQFIIVDTFARFAAIRKAEDEQRAGAALGVLQMRCLADARAMLVSDHHRKAGLGGVQDVIDDIMGNTVKTGVLDAALGLYRQRGQVNAELKATGRDIGEAEIAVRFDKQLLCWQYVGDAEAVRSDSLRSSILDAMSGNFSGEASVTQVAKFLLKDTGNIHREMQELVVLGKVVRMEERRGRDVLYRVVVKG